MKKFLFGPLLLLGLASHAYAAPCDGAGIAGLLVGSNGSTCTYAKVNADGSVSVTSLSSPSARTIVTLDVKTVTTGGVAVTALAVGNKTAGGFITNPKGAAADLCINEIGAATGTTSSGDTTCIAAGQTYNLAPSAGAVSVISSDSSHPFSGYGLQ